MDFSILLKAIQLDLTLAFPDLVSRRDINGKHYLFLVLITLFEN